MLSQRVILVLSACACLAWMAAPASALYETPFTVDYWSSTELAPGQLGIAHALIASGGQDDYNGETSIAYRVQVGTNPDGSPIYSPIPADRRHGNGIPDSLELALLEYIYIDATHPLHDAVVEVFDENRNALFTWANPAGPCESPTIAWLSSTEADTFGNPEEPPDVVFPGCTLNAAWLLKFAGHCTVSRHMEADNLYPVLFSWFNAWRDDYINLHGDSRINRTMLTYLDGEGDADQDGVRNVEEWRSVMEALGLTYVADDPRTAEFDESTDWPDLTILATKRPTWPGATNDRGRRDKVASRYIDVALNIFGGDPDDPTPVEIDPMGVMSQSGSAWFEAKPGLPLTLSATVRYAVPPATYQWYKDGVALTNGGRISGAHSTADVFAVYTTTLTITDPVEADSGIYWCVVNDTRPTKTMVSTTPVNILVVPDGGLPVVGIAGLGLLAAGLTAVAARRLRKRS